MANTKKSLTYRLTKKRINKTRARAQWVGLLYAVAAIALAVLAIIPTLNINYAFLPIFGFGAGKQSFIDGIKSFSRLNLLEKATLGLYGVMLIVLITNILRIFNKFNWLFKKKASRTYGFNRNVYAMESIAKYFSSSFAIVLLVNVTILLLNGSYAGTERLSFATGVLVFFGFLPKIPVALIMVAFATFAHLALGFIGAKTSLFVDNASNTGIVEEKRAYGRFAPLFRNTIQLLGIFGIAYCLLQTSQISVYAKIFFKIALSEGEVAGGKLPVLFQGCIFVLWVILTIYATSMKEFDRDGVDVKGRGVFMWFIFFAFALSVALYLFNKNYSKFDLVNVESFTGLALVAGTFGLSIIELLTRNAPREKIIQQTLSDDMEFDEYISETTAIPPAPIVPQQPMDYYRPTCYHDNRVYNNYYADNDEGYYD